MSNKRDFDSYSQLQLTILKWMFVPSAVLSAISSMCLLWQILFAQDAPHRQRKTYHRVLLGVSVIDIISSTSLVVIPALLYSPDNEPGPVCTIEGAIKVFGSSASNCYMACLSVYFLLIIRYSVPDRKIVAQYEMWFHLISILYPLFIVCWGLIDRAFNPFESSLGCYFQEYPIGCLEDRSCQRGAMASMLTLIGGVFPFFIVLTILISTNVLIYLTVQKTEARIRRHDFSSSNPCGNFSINQQSHSTGSQQPSKTKRVAAQSFLFVLGFFLTYLSSLILYIVKVSDPNGLRHAEYFVLQVMVGTTWPLQGFFDFLIYVRPRYLQYRRHNNEWSRGKCFFMAAFSLKDFRNNTARRSCSNNNHNNHSYPNQIVPISSAPGEDLEVPSYVSVIGKPKRGKVSTTLHLDGTWDDEL